LKRKTNKNRKTLTQLMRDLNQRALTHQRKRMLKKKKTKRLRSKLRKKILNIKLGKKSRKK